MPEQAGVDRLLAAASTLVAQSGASGAAVAVWRDGRPILEAGIGTADLAGTMPLDAHARFPVYSATRTLIAARILRLVENGAVALSVGVSHPLFAEPAYGLGRLISRNRAGSPNAKPCA